MSIIIAEILCPYPQSFSNSQYSFDTRTPGSVVEYICNGGYYLAEGMLSWQCSEAGDWTGEEPVCQGKCSEDEKCQ